MAHIVIACTVLVAAVPREASSQETEEAWNQRSELLAKQVDLDPDSNEQLTLEQDLREQKRNGVVRVMNPFHKVSSLKES